MEFIVGSTVGEYVGSPAKALFVGSEVVGDIVGSIVGCDVG